MNLLFRLLGADISISFTSVYQKEVTDRVDLRSGFHWQNSVDKNIDPSKNRYRQVFSAKYGFTGNLSMIDLLFNEGAKSMEYLMLNFR
jgi:hypothetical protein